MGQVTTSNTRCTPHTVRTSTRQRQRPLLRLRHPRRPRHHHHHRQHQHQHQHQHRRQQWRLWGWGRQRECPSARSRCTAALSPGHQRPTLVSGKRNTTRYKGASHARLCSYHRSARSDTSRTATTQVSAACSASTVMQCSAARRTCGPSAFTSTSISTWPRGVCPNVSSSRTRKHRRVVYSSCGAQRQHPRPRPPEKDPAPSGRGARTKSKVWSNSGH